MSDHHIVAVDQILPARLFRRIIIPSRNQRDLEEIPGHVHTGITFHLAHTMDDVMAKLF